MEDYKFLTLIMNVLSSAKRESDVIKLVKKRQLIN